MRVSYQTIWRCVVQSQESFWSARLCSFVPAIADLSFVGDKIPENFREHEIAE
jgi:hypothetical protein